MRKTTVAALVFAAGAGTALGVHSQLEDGTPAVNEQGELPGPMTLDQARAINEAPVEACPTLVRILPVYEQTDRELADLTRDRITFLDCHG